MHAAHVASGSRHVMSHVRGSLQAAQAHAAQIANALGLAGLARVDAFMAVADGTLFVIEVNTIPGLSPNVLFQQALAENPPIYPDQLCRLQVSHVLPRTMQATPAACATAARIVHAQWHHISAADDDRGAASAPCSCTAISMHALQAASSMHAPQSASRLPCVQVLIALSRGGAVDTDAANMYSQDLAGYFTDSDPDGGATASGDDEEERRLEEELRSNFGEGADDVFGDELVGEEQLGWAEGIGGSA
jgi:D-ala D-ala ligase C-terminus